MIILICPIVARKAAQAKPIGLCVADKGYDSEENHVLIRDELGGYSIIPPREYDNVPVWRTMGKYRKQIKREGYSEKMYHQRSLVETVNSVIKRTMGDTVYSRLVRLQNREIEFRFIAYNTHRLIVFLVILRISTEPDSYRSLNIFP